MEEKIYTSGDIEELYEKVGELFDEDFEKVEEVLAENGLSEYSSFFGEVMAGGLDEEQVCTPTFCKEFCEGMQKILDNNQN